jgi:hypothetical protein
MKRFTIAVSDGGGETGPWLDTGFVEFIPGREDDGRARRPDVLIISPAQAEWEKIVAESWPKVLFLGAEAPPVLTAELAEAFNLHRWHPHGLNLAVATRLEASLDEPQWAAYLQDDPLTGPVAAKAAADTVYRHLLADIFRDTAEWCGHTFSVVTGI